MRRAWVALVAIAASGWLPGCRGGLDAVAPDDATVLLSETELAVGESAVVVSDTVARLRDGSPAAQAQLDALVWPAERFVARVSPMPAGSAHRFVLTFPSPRVLGEARVDEARVLWYPAVDGAGEVVEGPAVVIMHSVDAPYRVARTLGPQFAAGGVHAFVVLLPGFTDPPEAWREVGGAVWPGVTAIRHGPQGIANARRALDAVRALPEVDAERVALMGVSLGGFGAATVAALDDSLRRVTLLGSGGDLADVLANGGNEAATVARSLREAGVTEAELAATLAVIEPLTLAHRLDPARTHLWLGAADTTIPRAGVDALAEAIGLPAGHVHTLPGGHLQLMGMYLGRREYRAIVEALRE